MTHIKKTFIIADYKNYIHLSFIFGVLHGLFVYDMIL
jgi:hypothetical protein